MHGLTPGSHPGPSPSLALLQPVVDLQKTAAVGGCGAPHPPNNSLYEPPDLPLLLTRLALFSLEASAFVSECGKMSAPHARLNIQLCCRFIIVLQVSLEVLIEACAYKCSH